jgi:hypothetical protein
VLLHRLSDETFTSDAQTYNYNQHRQSTISAVHRFRRPLLAAGAVALLGHVSAQMGVRYARLFDHTVRTEYERALMTG